MTFLFYFAMLNLSLLPFISSHLIVYDKWQCKQFPLSLIGRFWYSIHSAAALMKEVPFMAMLHSALQGSICHSLSSHACLVILSTPHALESWQEGQQ
jgi:hypothetical protein